MKLFILMIVNMLIVWLWAALGNWAGVAISASMLFVVTATFIAAEIWRRNER